MKVIITENQKNDLLKKLIMTEGWETAASMVGGPTYLAEMVFNNNPMNFLNMYNNLEVVRSEEDKEYILFRLSKGHNIITLNEISNVLYVSRDEISSFLDEGFSLTRDVYRKIVSKWFDKNYSNFIPTYFTKFDIRFPQMGWVSKLV
jgi:hypothetical protein